MHKLRGSLTWLIPGVIALFLLGGLVICAPWSPHQTPLPECEAMRPSLLYQGRYYYETEEPFLPSSDRGAPVTTIGDGPAQAHSCLWAGATVYSVKGRPTTTDLALDTDGLRLFEVSLLTSTPARGRGGASPMAHAQGNVVGRGGPGVGSPEQNHDVGRVTSL